MTPSDVAKTKRQEKCPPIYKVALDRYLEDRIDTITLCYIFVNVNQVAELHYHFIYGCWSKHQEDQMLNAGEKKSL